MRISQVESFLLSYPLPQPEKLSYFGGNRVILKRDSMLIRIQTDDGLTGWAPGPGSEKVHQCIQGQIAPFLKNHLLADPDALRIKFFQAFRQDLEAQKAYGALEVALYDLIGQKKNLPISALLGERERDSIKLYGSAGMYMSPEEYAAEAVEVKRLGFQAYKMRPGLGPEEDLRAVRLIRESVGDDMEIMVDGHTWWRMGDRNYSAETITRLAQKLVEFDITWLEEPLTPSDHPAYTRLREEGNVPLASGEHEHDDEGFFDLIDNDCVDFVQADLVCQGGYSSGRKIIAETARRNLRFAFHCWGTDLEVLSAAHLGICWPEEVVEWVEYPIYRSEGVNVMYPFPLATDVLAEPLTIENGELVVPRKPGLGIRVNESVIEKYPWIPGPWSRFQLISPPGEWAVTGDHSIQWDSPAS